jgi:hypothetical protein
VDRVREQVATDSATLGATAPPVGRCEDEEKASLATDRLDPIRVGTPVGFRLVRPPLSEIVVQVPPEILYFLLDPGRKKEPVGQQLIVATVELTALHKALPNHPSFNSPAQYAR